MNFENLNLNDNYEKLLNILKTNNYNDDNNINYTINYIFISLIDPLRKKIIKLKNENNKLKKKIEKNDKLDSKCGICFENSCSIVFIPCGHLCMCNECSSKYDNYNLSCCPICRSNGNRYLVYK